MPELATRPRQPEFASPHVAQTEAAELEGARSGDRPEFFTGYDAVRAFVLREWERELDYRLKKELWTYEGDHISVRFEYEWRDPDSGQWTRTRGLENWVIGRDGLIRRGDARIDDFQIGPVA